MTDLKASTPRPSLLRKLVAAASGWIKKQRRTLTPNYVGGLALFLSTVLGLAAVCWVAWSKFGPQLKALLDQRLSVPLLLAALSLLYLLIVSLRMLAEPHYANYFWGRVQEVAFIKGTHRLLPYWAATVAAITGATWYFQNGMPVYASALSVLAVMLNVFKFIVAVSGAWIRPAEKEEYFLLRPAALGTQDEVSPDDAKMAVPQAYKALRTPESRRLFVPDLPQWRLLNGFLINDRVNHDLQKVESILLARPLVRRPEIYELPHSLLHYREVALIHERAKGGSLYNESKVRLNVNLDEALETDKPVEIQQTDYYSSVCSNELAKYLIYRRDEPLRNSTDLFAHARDSAGRLLGLDRSPLSNHLGGGTLAISGNRELLLSKQGRLALLSSGLYAPAGSGSFDWRDQAGATTLGDLIKQGLERELLEECDFLREDIVQTFVLGFARDLSRAGKPDFLGLTLVKGRANAAVRKAETGFIDQHLPLTLESRTAQDLREEFKHILKEHRWHASAALLITLEVLIDAQTEVYEQIVSFLENA